MLRLSKKADYALMAMKHLALRGDQGSSSAREIAALYDIPIELMAKVLQRLVRRGLLASSRRSTVRSPSRLVRPKTGSASSLRSAMYATRCGGFAKGF